LIDEDSHSNFWRIGVLLCLVTQVHFAQLFLVHFERYSSSEQVGIQGFMTLTPLPCLHLSTSRGAGRSIIVACLCFIFLPTKKKGAIQELYSRSHHQMSRHPSLLQVSCCPCSMALQVSGVGSGIACFPRPFATSTLKDDADS
jgi:hypothetical protein